MIIGIILAVTAGALVSLQTILIVKSMSIQALGQQRR